VRNAFIADHFAGIGKMANYYFSQTIIIISNGVLRSSNIASAVE